MADLPEALRPRQIRIFQIGDLVGRGRTESRFAEGRDQEGRVHSIILKLRDPCTPAGHYKGTSLAAELVFAMIGRRLGLRVPDYAIAHLSDIIANAARDQTLRERLKRNVGLNFATVRLIPQPDSWDPACRLLSLNLRQTMDDILAFDAAIMNGDRKSRNPNLLWDGGETVHVIDHGLACAAVYLMSAQDRVRTPSPLLPDPEVHAHCAFQFLRHTGQQCDQLLSRWQQLVTSDFLDAVRVTIPPEWERQTGDLDSMFTFLKDREARAADITTELRRVLT
jgi:hypothetical protein